MFFSTVKLRQGTFRASRFLLSTSVAALSLAYFAAPASAEAFVSMVAMQAGKVIGPNGQVSQWTGAKTPVVGKDADGRPLMTIEQTQQKALLDWQDFRLKSDEVLEFQQQAANWIAVNRVHGTQASEINGEIRATGSVYVLDDNGVLIGKDAKINTRQLVTGRGVSDVNVDGNKTTIVQSAEKATLDWSNMNVAAGDVLKIQQEKKDWILLNRSYAAAPTRIDGSIEADGHIYLVAPKGLSVDGSIKAQQVILSSLYMRDDQFNGSYGLTSYARDYNNRVDPTFSNTWLYSRVTGSGSNANEYLSLLNPMPDVFDAADPLKYNVTIGRTGSVTTGNQGKVMLFGPNVTNKGTINIQDEGQVILAAGENIYLTRDSDGMFDAYVGAYNPLSFMRVNIPYMRPPQKITDERWQALYETLLGKDFAIGDTLSSTDYNALFQSAWVNGTYIAGGLIGQYLNTLQAQRVADVGYAARNEGIINAKRGGTVDFRGFNLQQMGALDMTSTALFRGNITMRSGVWDFHEYANGDTDGRENAVPGNGSVVFGVGSLTQITPDLDSKDAIALTSGTQSVGSLKINARTVDMQRDSVIYMPSGTMSVLLDAGAHVYDNNRGAGANQGNEDGSRFFMDSGATIDLSGWKSTVLPMGYHQVTGKLYAAQLADSPLQQDGPLARKEITVDRRYGTNLANWQSFDNLNQGTLDQFLTDGGKLTMDIGDDFIMKAGSVIDVSGGMTTYEAGFVYTTLLRKLDGTVIDIRAADPDELYMGLANEWVEYDTKWGKQTTYYIPLMSSVQGAYETSYVQGGKGGSIAILAPDAVLQGTLKGETVTGRYQRGNSPAGGTFSLNEAGESEGEYVSNSVLIAAIENVLPSSFAFDDLLSSYYGNLFGDEHDPATDPVSSDTRHNDNTTLASADFFNRSTMASYGIMQNYHDEVGEDGPATAMLVEAGAELNLANGGSLKLLSSDDLKFLGSVRTEGGNVALQGGSLELGADSRIDTHGSWYSDYEVDEPVALNSVPRINGGNISLGIGAEIDSPVNSLILPETVVLDSSGGAWVDRNGKLTAGKGGNLAINASINSSDSVVDLGAIKNARAYGLGGNGTFSLSTSDAIVIGEALPDAEETGGRSPMLLDPSFFHNSGYSSISLLAPSITITQGTQVEAISATLQLKQPSLNNSVPPAYWMPSGTDIYDVAEVAYVPLEQRSAALRQGMNLSFSGAFDSGVGSLLSTELGGKIVVGGNAVIAGTLLAPAGTIALGAGTADASGGLIHVTGTGRLLAPGAALITWHGVDSIGRALVDGQLYDGGSISLSSYTVTLDAGSVLDVSGTSAVFAKPTLLADGSEVRMPTTLASNGGTISIDGSVLAVNDATYKAAAGGTGARGGTFNLSWSGPYGQSGGGSGGYYTPETMLDELDSYFQWGFFTDIDGNMVTSLYGTDLSRIDWASWGVTNSFSPGFVLNSREEAVAVFAAYDAASKGAPPMLVIGDPSGIDVSGPPQIPAIEVGMTDLFSGFFGYTLPEISTAAPAVTFLSPQKIGQGGFSSLAINADPGVIFSGDVDLGGKKADGSYIFDTIAINAAKIIGRDGADVHLEAGVVTLNNPGTITPDAYYSALEQFAIHNIADDTSIEIKAGTLLEVGSAVFQGFSDTSLVSGGDIRLAGYGNVGVNVRPTGTLYTPGHLTLKADQVYAGTGRIFTVQSDTGITILAQDDGGPINGSPYEAAAELTIKAPRIEQNGIVRSPLGTITLAAYDNGTEGSGEVILSNGSLTSVSADGKMIPYGYTSNSDTWIDPFTGLELTTLPTKTINLTGDVVDLQQGATLDVSGGGDLYAREFVAGTGGTYDWLTGYRDKNYKWVSAPGTIYAVMPDFEGNIAPLGFGASQIGVGDKVYLSGGSGLPAGYYTLLPAEYALLPGAFRVTANHRASDAYGGAAIGTVANLADGSSIQAGYIVSGASGARDQLNSGFLVMPGSVLRDRSYYIETQANSFFSSDAYLKKALRINRPVTDVPRRPLDGGSVVFRAGESLNLDGKLNSSAGEDGRGGFADIASEKIVVTGADTDLSRYDGYLVLDSDQLNGFGAESLLIGGVRSQGAVNMELTVSGADVIVDNAGSTLKGPELLLASKGNLNVLDGSKLEATGKISGSSGDLRVLPSIAAFVDDNGTPTYTYDDVPVHGALDQGAVLRLSSGEQVDILRDANAVADLNALRANPAALAAVNAKRVAAGLAPIAEGGKLNIADGASIVSSRSVALDATNDTTVGGNATLQARQLSASSSKVSLGQVPAGTGGLVFTGSSLDVLGQAEDLALKSYSTIDIYGDIAIDADKSLTLDAGTIRIVDADLATVSAGTLTLTNTNGAATNAAAGTARLVLNATNVRLEGKDKAISGIGELAINASERVIGAGDSTLYVPGNLSITASGMTTESGARLFFDAAGDVSVGYRANAALPVFQSYGGTLGLTGASIRYAGQTRMTGGTISLAARSGDVTLESGAVLDVTSNVSTFYDKEVGVGAGTVRLVADQGNVNLMSGSLIDVSGTSVGGDAGTLVVRAGLGEALLGGTVKGSATAGYASGSFELVTRTLTDFAALDAALDAGGFLQSRRFEVNQGDVTIGGNVGVQNLKVVTNDGSITVTGTVQTVGANGGTIQLSAADNVLLASGGKLLAAAKSDDGAGGTVLLETAGRNGGSVATESGSLIDVSGQGEGGRVVRFRAPQIGNDIAISALAGEIDGARSVYAEGYRVYDGVSTIDQSVIDRVSADATDFMAANATAIGNRLGAGVTVTAGIELHSDADMELVTDWDLSGLRFNGAPGILTLRAAGDILLNANLSDGFNNGGLMDGDSWSYSLTSGANLDSPDSTAVLAASLLADGKGSVIVGGTADTIEYYYDPAFANDTRLYRTDESGNFLRDESVYNYKIGFYELARDPVTGKYIDPLTGALIEKDPVTGDYADTTYYAKRPLPWIYFTNGGAYEPMRQDGVVPSYYSTPSFNGNGFTDDDLRPYIQWDNSTGYTVRTGTGSIAIAAGRDLVLSQRPSVIYTAGRNADALDGFYAPASAQYGTGGGDIAVTVYGDIVASEQTPQMPSGYLKQLGSLNTTTGLFTAGGNGRAFDQTTWWVDYDSFQGGIGALGGGNIAIAAEGDVHNLGVAIPTSGRVTGNTVKLADGSNQPMALTTTGGGDLTMKVGGNIAGGIFYVGEGLGDITAGGAFVAGSTVHTLDPYKMLCAGSQGCYIHTDPRPIDRDYDVYAMFFTSTGRFDIKSGGDMDIDGVMDPLLSGAELNYQDWKLVSFNDQTSARLFSAGGDVTLWNNGLNTSLVYAASGKTGLFGGSLAPVHYFGTDEHMEVGRDSIAWDLRPADLTVVAATGDVRVLGDMILMPSATGNLSLLAGDNVYIGYGTAAVDPYLQYGYSAGDNWMSTANYRGGAGGIVMSQADMSLIRTPVNQPLAGYNYTVARSSFLTAGNGQPFGVDYLPDLHVGDTEPVRIYAVGGDVITSPSAAINIPKQLWVQAERNIYFPSYSIQHNNTLDLSLVRAGKGIYFQGASGGMSDGYIAITGPGRLEIEAGTDIYIPSNAKGITSGRITFATGEWKPDEAAADIAITTGLNQAPAYGAFEDAYLNPQNVGKIEDYLIDADTGLPLYLFDREYERAQGATGEYATPEYRGGLVNYVRQLQGLPRLASKTEQQAYLDTAWSYWQALTNDYKTPFYRSVLFLELRTTGREANDSTSDRYNTTFRGYNAIATLFPGAQKADDEALADGESRWSGDFETYASRVVSSGGGKIEFVIPGGALRMANIAATPSQTGQPAYTGDQGNALRAGVLTTDGGEINVLAHSDVILNQSRLLTTKGGNVMIWSSYGDIAAGKGAKTSISPQYFSYNIDNWARLDREPAGLPTGAGIGTLATQEGVPPADVDLVAPAGVVDAGDAGIRVSGNFNVFAIEILGTDNIDVGGVTTGLPVPPAAPPTSLDVGDAAAKSNAVDQALEDANRRVRRNSSVLSPSLIEVRVTGYGDCDENGNPCPTRGRTPTAAPQQSSERRPQQYASLTEMEFNIPSQSLDAAIRAVGRIAGVNILYDAALVKQKKSPALGGRMTPEEALEKLLAGLDVIPVRVGERTIMLKRQ
jgi:filamentous hemagglutinin family protein